jgi:threonyl-tRNA synthetase
VGFLSAPTGRETVVSQIREAAPSIEVVLPDGSVRSVPVGTPAEEVARAAGLDGLGSAVAARVDGRPADLYRPLDRDCHLSLVRLDDPDALEIVRHTTSHVMAQAVKELFPDARIAQGPAIEEGFYYDFRRDEPFTDEDLPRIEERMREIVARDLPIRRHEVPKDEALAIFAAEEEPYKLHFVREKGGSVVSYYQQGDFRDFCLGPHLPATGRLGAFKLLSVAGAYWLGSERNEMLWRIYGTAFPTQEELDAHLERLEEARKRDHRRLIKELDLASVQEVAGSGLVFWHPKGTTVRTEIENYMREALGRRGYVFVTTPHLFRDTLFRISGHYDFYRDNMYTLAADEEEFAIKPMNCPGHVMIYRSRLRSYRDLPVRMAEFGTVYRYERSGTVQGLFRVRGFTQDDAHMFCTPEQLVGEVDDCLDLIGEVFRTFGFDEVRYELSVWDPKHSEKYAGEAAEWDAAEKALVQALANRRLEYRRYEGEAAFYGPKIDVQIFSAIGREFSLATNQVDFAVPPRFNLTYVDKDGQEKTPYMVHRAILGSMERFFGILVEHYGGAFPVWLSPLQARVLPVSEKVADYADALGRRLTAAGIRTEVDRRSDKVGAKIRDAELEKIPYMLVVGPREAQADAVSLRVHHQGDQGSLATGAFIERAQRVIATRALEP